ncbi:MAG: hypothetical protein QXD03_04420 [Candidatus Anstonellales archaeon]
MGITAKELIEKIIKEKSKGNETMRRVVEMSVKTKLTLKGVNVDKCLAENTADVYTIEKIKLVAKDLGVVL